MKYSAFILITIFLMLSCRSESVNVTVVPTEDSVEEQPVDENPDNGDNEASEFDNGTMREL